MKVTTEAAVLTLLRIAQRHTGSSRPKQPANDN